MILQNDTQVSNTVLEFDVAVVRTVADFTLTSYNIALNFNSALANGGTLTFTYLAATTGLATCTPTAPLVVSDGGTPNLYLGSNAGSDVISTTPVRIGRFRLTNTIPFGLVPPNINWDFAGIYITQVNINNSNLTVNTNHTNTLTNGVALPVELVSFTAEAARLGAELNWKTVSETNNTGFDVERMAAGSSKSSGVWTKIGSVAGAGTTSEPKEYTFTDKMLRGGSYSYRLKQIDRTGAFKYSPEAAVTIAVPKEFTLSQNYPNPFNPATNFDFTLPSTGRVTLKVYNTIGEEVASLFDGIAVAGEYQQATFDASKLASGIYFARLTYDGKSLLRKMLLMK
jgi:hypothetical protein